MLIKYTWRGVRLAGVVAAMIAASYAIAIWNRDPPLAVAGGKKVESLDVISLQIDILAITMAAVGIGLAVVGLFGFQVLKEAAEARAEGTAKEVAAKVADRFIDQEVPPAIRREVTAMVRKILNERKSAGTGLEGVVDSFTEEADDGK